MICSLHKAVVFFNINSVSADMMHSDAKRYKRCKDVKEKKEIKKIEEIEEDINEIER